MKKHTIKVKIAAKLLTDEQDEVHHFQCEKN